MAGGVLSSGVKHPTVSSTNALPLQPEVLFEDDLAAASQLSWQHLQVLSSVHLLQTPSIQQPWAKGLAAGGLVPFVAVAKACYQKAVACFEWACLLSFMLALV